MRLNAVHAILPAYRALDWDRLTVLVAKRMRLYSVPHLVLVYAIQGLSPTLHLRTVSLVTRIALRVVA